MYNVHAFYNNIFQYVKYKMRGVKAQKARQKMFFFLWRQHLIDDTEK